MMNPEPDSRPEPASPPPAREGKRGLYRVGALVVVLLLGVYAIRLTGLFLETQRAAIAEAQLEAEVEALGAEVRSLETAAAFATTDAYVEHWAREERHWTREGDEAILVDRVTPEPTAEDEGEGLVDRLRRWTGGAR